MPRIVQQIELPYPQRAVFDLVADIESYPQFLPHVVAARIVDRVGPRLIVDQVVRFRLLRLRFTTEAALDPPSAILVVCKSGPFGSFSQRWTFEASPSGGTHLRCAVEFEFRSSLLQRAYDAAQADLLRATMRAFETRAQRLCAGTASSR